MPEISLVLVQLGSAESRAVDSRWYYGISFSDIPCFSVGFILGFDILSIRDFVVRFVRSSLAFILSIAWHGNRFLFRFIDGSRFIMVWSCDVAKSIGCMRSTFGWFCSKGFNGVEGRDGLSKGRNFIGFILGEIECKLRCGKCNGSWMGNLFATKLLNDGFEFSNGGDVRVIRSNNNVLWPRCAWGTPIRRCARVSFCFSGSFRLRDSLVSFMRESNAAGELFFVTHLLSMLRYDGIH